MLQKVMLVSLSALALATTQAAALKDCKPLTVVAEQLACVESNIQELSKAISDSSRARCEAQEKAKGNSGSALNIHTAICTESRLKQIQSSIK
jgi:hypothetical protein